MVPSGETLRAARFPFLDVLCRGRANVVEYPLYVVSTGAVDAPTQSGSTFTLLDPAGEAVVDAAAVTVTSSIAEYTIPALTLPTTLTPLGEGWKEEWRLVFGGVTYLYERTAALALTNLIPTVTDQDITDLYPSWTRARGSVVTTYGAWIAAAWKQLVQRLITEGHLLYLVRTPEAFREMHLNLSIALVARGVKPTSGTGESSWLADAQHHEKLYEAAYKATNWQADYDHDGRVDDPTKRQRGGTTLHAFGATRGRAPVGWT